MAEPASNPASALRRATGRATSRATGRTGFALALVVVAVALVIGSGVASSAPRTDAQRAAALETQIRCPSCEDISVAESSAASAIAVRHEVARLAAAGVGNRAIEQRLVAQYGPSILLSPPDSGLSSLVWLVPLVAGILAAGGLAIFFWRRSRSWRRLRAEVPA
jgi:cytochrome c-type biogenesis protein CcmH